MIRGLAAMQDRNFRWFFLARAITMITGSMSSIALAFAVLEIDNDARSLSFVLTAFTVSNIVFVLFGGVIADRLPRALIIQACYVVDILSIGAIAALLFTGNATIPLLVLLSIVNGASTAFVLPAMQGIIPQLTTPEHLQQANAMLSFVRSAVTIGGPVLAGILVATAGPAWAMVVQAAGWAVAIPVLALVKLPPPSHAGGTTMFHDLRIGWREFWSRSWLWTVVLAFMVMNAIHIGAWGVVGPYIAKNNDLLGITGWGWVLSAEGAGVLLMTLLLMWFPLRRPLRYGMIGIAAFAIPVTILGVHPAVVLLAMAAFIAGAGAEVFSTGWNLAMMENIPGEKLSRVASYDMLGSFVVMPIGTLIYGWLITHADPATVLVTSGVVYASIALVTLMVPSVWRMGRPEAVTKTPAELADS
ncbi:MULTISPECIES: MFS transporter [Microbacterium]|jgi:MFS family permease|uniref:MFS transporter n=1 Tax=Microbacterium TaxID=33882 RepID=UPI000CB4D5FE|nr:MULTISPECIES: MFS transporter [Microbacterium]PKQ34266.1 MAG: MFS transporter [Actinobacteria bacterium HGW-Actinobacteria-11]MCK8466765.1 MFS transporter [Microbacterium aurugineum]MCK8476748.1 MFS transporter [Microbacterium aurugineum]QEA28839.1 MFS transporter [Microbacterium sp. CBA3102]TFB17368.1 MFS transporter [Microbacterium sp. 3H14]